MNYLYFYRGNASQVLDFPRDLRRNIYFVINYDLLRIAKLINYNYKPSPPPSPPPPQAMLSLARTLGTN